MPIDWEDYDGAAQPLTRRAPSYGPVQWQDLDGPDAGGVTDDQAPSSGSLKAGGHPILSTLARVGLPLLGGAVGSIVPGVGTAIGAAAGAGLGGLLGEYAGEKLEGRAQINPYQIALQGGIAAIPGGLLAKRLGAAGRLARAGYGALEGAGINTAASLGSDVAEGQDLDWDKAKQSAWLGGGAGAAVGSLLHGDLGRVKSFLGLGGETPRVPAPDLDADALAASRRATYLSRKSGNGPLAVPGADVNTRYDAGSVPSTDIFGAGRENPLGAWNARRDAPRVAAGRVGTSRIPEPMSSHYAPEPNAYAQGQNAPDVDLRPGRGGEGGQPPIFLPDAGEIDWQDVNPIGPTNQGVGAPDVDLRPGHGREGITPETPAGDANDWADLDAANAQQQARQTLMDRLASLGKRGTRARASAAADFLQREVTPESMPPALAATPDVAPIPLDTAEPTAPAEPVGGAPLPKREGVGTVPAGITALHQRLYPQWEQTLAATGIDQREPLLGFAHRIAAEENPRQLMGAERKVVRELREAGQLPSPEDVRAQYGEPSRTSPPAVTTDRAFPPRDPNYPTPVPERTPSPVETEWASRVQEAPPKRFADLDPVEQAEWLRARSELENFQHARRAPIYEEGRIEGWIPTQSNAPIYHAINAEGGTRRTNAQIRAAMEKYEAGGKPGPIVRDVLRTVRRSLAGEDVGRRMLPEDAIPLGSANPLAESQPPSPTDFPFGANNPGNPENEGGFINPRLLLPVAGGLTGAATGAARDKDHRIRGGLEGGLLGVLAGMGLNRAVLGPAEVGLVRNAHWRPQAGRHILGKRVGDVTVPEAQPRFSGQEGFANAHILTPVATTALGALAGPVLFRDEDPLTAATGGGLLGLGAGLATSAGGRQLLERARMSNLLSGMAIPKSLAGNVGALASYGLERGKLGRVASEFLSPETTEAVKRAWRDAPIREAGQGRAMGPLGIPGRIMGTFDAATRSALQRAGATADEAEQMVLMGRPKDAALAGLNDALHRPTLGGAAMRQVLPFARTASNALERGVERIPGVGALPSVRAMTNPSNALARRRQMLGALALAGGAGIGYATRPGGALEDEKSQLGMLGALAGPYALPIMLGAGAGRAVGEGGDLSDVAGNALSGVIDQAPIPHEWALQPGRYARSFMPFGSFTRELGDLGLLPVNPADLDQSGLIRPALSQVPLLNDLLVPYKHRGRPPRPRVSSSR